MPYYVVPQVVDEVRDEAGNLVSRTVRPQLPGGLAFTGDTDGVNYLVWTDRDLSELGEGSWREVRGLELTAVVAARPRMRLEDVQRWSRGRGPALVPREAG